MGLTATKMGWDVKTTKSIQKKGATPPSWTVYADLEGNHPDRTFYDLYDSGYFTAKCGILGFIAEHLEEARSFFSPHDFELEDSDPARFKLEIYFSEFQCFEALFALLMAPFQPDPHCVYMSQYSPRNLKQQVDAYLRGDIASITMNRAQTKPEFLDLSVYSRFRSNESPETWGENLESLAWLLDRMAHKYTGALEYNSYKHGLRVAYRGPSVFKLSSEDDAQVVKWESEDSVWFMEVDGGADPPVLKQAIKHFDLEESWHNLHLMKAIIESIRVTRLARLIPGTQELVMKDFRGVDRSPVQKFWAKDFKFSLNIGKRPES